MPPGWSPDAPAPPGDCYLVGGAVRDALLGEPVAERDWVVVGSNPEAMQAAGYRPVGKDFPVFLHPVSGEEYALARTERKSGHGYGGFTFHTAPDVTLEQDLARRDLSINAIAQAADGRLIDPYGGAQDLSDRVLRHVSPHFVEDPLRVLRVARFHARLRPYGFEVHPDTRALLNAIAASGELAHLTPERSWKETEKALLGPAPQAFFGLLREVHALSALYPELDALYGVPQTARYHPEIDTGVHMMLALEQAARLSPRLDVRFAVLCHDFGKAKIPGFVLPGHRGHEKRGVPIVEAFCERLRVPRALREIAVLVAEHHLHCHKALELRAQTLLKLFDALDIWRRPERLEAFLLACEADARGRTGLSEEPYPQADYLREAAAAASAVSARQLLDRGLQGPALGRELRRERLRALEQLREQRRPGQH